MNTLKNISILGSTGSIGTQSLDVVRNNKGFKVVALSTNTNIELLEKQALEFKPKIVAVANEYKGKILKDRLKGHNIKVEIGMNGLISVATEQTADVVITSVVGMVGLLPTLEAIKCGKTIALANKETLVTAGEIVIEEARKEGVNIIPVDSEHSAIFQCLQSGKYEEIEKIILTASGGPFRGKNKQFLEKVTKEDALKHPNWSMGKKITIDSATLMNKGLEVIEAKWLFNIDVDMIDVVVHPQSIVHSMVEFRDGSIIAQMGAPDMKVPIQYALTYPDRLSNDVNKLKLTEVGTLSFEPPSTKDFPCLQLAIEAIKIGGTMPAVLNAVNEIAVDMFLNDKIRFLDIPCIIEKLMGLHKTIKKPSLEEIIQSDNWARNNAKSYLTR
ncbi:1-deoxy-D-xylulose-5-phosphate reductoisomerase [Gottschalkia purinilytica]|uniref:1-deoxy-D-xylulose-5-phosphate reductoisomerase n=1 Tax=Gottschalkia purinilytica TaxID=1503 RepID=UPI001F1D3D59|nr:1-deoxy-D-xylulose-5-phosphate reductoisomerase [Gottschalkia purinilytica]